MRSFLPRQVRDVITEFMKLPGIGPKSAERLTFYLLRAKEQQEKSLSNALEKLKAGIRYCVDCFSISTEDRCVICEDRSRDRSIVCVVEDVLDAVALEKTGEFRGLYHVLHGVISPLHGVRAEDLKIAHLVKRVKTDKDISEIILAMNPNVEGEATALFIADQLKPFNKKLTRIARGLPVGGDLEYADDITLSRALSGRQIYS